MLDVDKRKRKNGEKARALSANETLDKYIAGQPIWLSKRDQAIILDVKSKMKKITPWYEKVPPPPEVD